MFRWTTVLMLLLLAGCATGQHAVTVQIDPQPEEAPKIQVQYKVWVD